MIGQPEILYLSYNGITEPLVRSQVLNYLEGLVARGYRFLLVTFEKSPPPEEIATELRENLRCQGIEWTWLSYHRRLGPVSTAWDVLQGFRLVLRLCRTRRIALVHARSFVPAVIARLVKKRLDIPFINDKRGFWVDEKVYKGSLRPNGMIYRGAKRLEGWVFRGSDAIVSLTDRGGEAIRSFPCFDGQSLPPLVTIPTCVDTAAVGYQKRSFVPPLIFGYVGSLGPGYLPEQVFQYFALAGRRFPGSRLHLITRTEPGRLWALAGRYGISREAIRLVAAAPRDVPRELEHIDIGLSFIKPHFAKLASCPTKVGEYLAAGIPVVSNAGIGDLDAIIEGEGVGHILCSFADADIDASLDAVAGYPEIAGLSRRCRQVSEDRFSLQKGIEHYAALYQTVLAVN